MLIKFWVILKKDLIMINMVKNSLNKVEDHQAIVASNSISHQPISETLTISLKNSSVVRILLQTFLMMTMISLVEVLEIDLEEEWWAMDSQVDLEEDSVED